MSFLPTFPFDPYCALDGPYDPHYNRVLVGTHSFFFQHPPIRASPSSVVSTAVEATPGRSKWGT